MIAETPDVFILPCCATNSVTLSPGLFFHSIYVTLALILQASKSAAPRTGTVSPETPPPMIIVMYLPLPLRRYRVTDKTWSGLLISMILMGLSGCATPPFSSLVGPEESGPKAPREARPHYHRVAPGEGLHAIARRYGLGYRQIADWNVIYPPYVIHPGQNLRLYPPEPGSRPSPPKRPPNQSVTHKPAKTHHPAIVADVPREASRRPTTSRPDKHTISRISATTSPESRWVWPTQGSVVQTFAEGDHTRQGIRIAGTSGQAIVAVAAGKVVYSGSGLPGYGRLIIIKHRGNYLSAYGFNRKLLVQDGDQVAQGQRIADMGNSVDGKSLLHFEIRRGDSVLDPLSLLPHR